MAALSSFSHDAGVDTPAARRRAIYLPWIFFIAYTAWLCWKLNHLLFGPFAVPTEDLAENDLLIVLAKSFSLVHGNMSRVGFWHPGPYFLYVAAFGEILFYDWFRVFSSYYAAQVFASTLMHGVAFTLAFRLWLQVTGRVVAALIAVAVAAAVMVWFAPLALTSRWVSYSFMASTTMMATGLAGMVLRGPPGCRSTCSGSCSWCTARPALSASCRS